MERCSRLSPCPLLVRREAESIQTKEETMKYALLIYDVPDAWEGLSDERRNAIFGEYFAVAQTPGVVGGEQLLPVETATTIRVKDGETLTTDGPFADTKEFLGGFFLLEADNLDSAIEIAARIPAAHMGGSVEIRPVVERQP
jgi:hypothetical protein